MIDLLEERRIQHAKRAGYATTRVNGTVYVVGPRAGEACPTCKATTAVLCTDSWHLPRFLGDPRIAAWKRQCEKRGSHEWTSIGPDGKPQTVPDDTRVGRVCLCGAWEDLRPKKSAGTLH